MNPDRMLSQILAGGAASGFAGGLAGGIAGGLLTSKAGRKLGKKALRVGGIAAVGGLAYAAWSRYRREQATGAVGPAAAATARPPEPSFERFVPAPDSEAGETIGRTLLLAMIAAAQADGTLDGAERRAIFERLSALDLSATEQAALFEQLERPVDLNALVAAAETPELAAEIYTASLLAIDVDTAAERGYLAMLAARLELPDALVASIHRELDAGASGPAAVAATG